MLDDRLRLLLGQLDGAWELLQQRLAGLTDEEYFWESVPGCWSLRRRGQAHGVEQTGSGEWLLDRQSPPPDPPPFTTIAWRMCHLAMSPMMRYDWTFGSHSLGLGETDWLGSADEAIAFLTEVHTRWRSALDGVTPDEMDQVGRSQFPHGLDPTVRFDDLLAWTNLEFIHHAAEIACLRDLYRSRSLSTNTCLTGHQRN